MTGTQTVLVIKITFYGIRAKKANMTPVQMDGVLQRMVRGTITRHSPPHITFREP